MSIEEEIKKGMNYLANHSPDETFLNDFSADMTVVNSRKHSGLSQNGYLTEINLKDCKVPFYYYDFSKDSVTTLQACRMLNNSFLEYNENPSLFYNLLMDVKNYISEKSAKGCFENYKIGIKVSSEKYGSATLLIIAKTFSDSLLKEDVVIEVNDSNYKVTLDHKISIQNSLYKNINSKNPYENITICPLIAKIIKSKDDEKYYKEIKDIIENGKFDNVFKRGHYCPSIFLSKNAQWQNGKLQIKGKIPEAIKISCIGMKLKDVILHDLIKDDILITNIFYSISMDITTITTNAKKLKLSECGIDYPDYIINN